MRSTSLHVWETNIKGMGNELKGKVDYSSFRYIFGVFISELALLNAHTFGFIGFLSWEGKVEI